MPTSAPTWDETVEDAPSWDDTEAFQAPEGRTPERQAQWQQLEDQKINERMRGGAGSMMEDVLGAGEDVTRYIASIPSTLYNTPANLANLIAGHPVMKTIAPGESSLGEILPSMETMSKWQIPAIDVPGAGRIQPTVAGETVAGLAKGSEDLLRGIATPEVMMTLPAGGVGGLIARAPAAAFSGQMIQHTPEAYQEFGRATVEGTPAEAVRAGVGALVSSAMIGHIGAAPLRGGRYARSIQEAATVHGDVRSQPVEGARQVPVEEGGAGVQPRAAQEAQVLLSPEHANLISRHSGGVPFEVVDLGEAGQGKAFVASMDPTNPKVVVNAREFAQWVDHDLKDLSPKARDAAIRSAFEHEEIHLATPQQDALPFRSSLSKFEKWVFDRQYLKGATAEEAFKDNPSMAEHLLGMENIRNRVEIAAKMTRSDFVGLAGKAKWTAKSLDALAQIVGKMRESFDPELKTHQRAVLGKVLENLKAAREARVGAPPPPDPDTLTNEEKAAFQQEIDDATAQAEKPAGEPKPTTGLTGDEMGEAQVLQAQVDAGPQGTKPADVKEFQAAQRRLEQLMSKGVNGPAMRRQVTIEKDDGTRYEAEFNGYYDMRKYGGTIVPSIGRSTNQGEPMSHGVLNKGERIISDVPSFEEWATAESSPAMRRSSKQEQIDKLADLRRAAHEGREAPGMKGPSGQPQYAPVAPQERVGAAEAGASPRLTPEQFMAGEISPRPLHRARTDKQQQKAAFREFRQAYPKASAEELKQWWSENLKAGSGTATAPRVSYDAPSFEEFRKSVYPNASREQLTQLWHEAVDRAIDGNKDLKIEPASPERLEQWRKALGMERLYGAGRVSSTGPAIIPKTTLEIGQATMPLEESKSGFKYRMEGAKALRERADRMDALQPGSKAARKLREKADRVAQGKPETGLPSHFIDKLKAGIKQRLYAQAEEGGADLSRREIFSDEIDYENKKTKYGAYRDLSRDDIEHPVVLNQLLRDQARGGSGDPETASRRLVAVVADDRSVNLLSTYNDAGVQRIVDPTGPVAIGKHHRPLDASFLKHYRPFSTLLLKDPVQNFNQRFKSVSEFMDVLGKEAYDRSQERGLVIPSPTRESIEEITRGRVAAGTPGLRGEGGGFMGPEARVVRAQLGLDQPEKLVQGPLDVPDVEAILAHVVDKFGDWESVGDVQHSIDSIIKRAAAKQLKAIDWNAIQGYVKIADAIAREHPDLADEAIVDMMAKQLYDNQKGTATSDEFIAKTMAQYAPEVRPITEPSPSGETTPTGARELTAPTRAPIERAGGPPLRGITGQAAEIARAEAGARSSARAEATTKAIQEAPPEEHPSTTAFKRTEQLAREAATEAEAEGPAMRRKQKLGPTLTDAIRNTASVYEEWMADRIGRVGGQLSKEAAAGFNHIIDRTKQLYGSLTPTLDPARKAAGSPRGRTLWLHGRDNVTPFAATRRTVGAIEGTRPVPPEAQDTVDMAKAANLEIGRMLEPVSPGFRAGGFFARNITAYGYDIIRQGRGDAWQKWTAGTARANRMPISEVRTFMRDWKETLDKPGVDVATVERVNQDFARKFPNVITDIKVGRMWQPVVHADLFNYLENAAQRAAHIRAFREQFPANAQGRKALGDLMENLRWELGPEYQKDLDVLMRTLQGHPTDNYASWGALSPVRLPGQAFRLMNQTVGNLMARMVLTGQMIVQPGENIAGSTPVFLGYKNYLRGMAELKQLYPQLEQQGMVNRVMYDFSFDPNSPVRSLFRISSNVLAKGFMEQWLNELQEGSAAATAHVVSERIRAGTLSDWEQRMLPETFRSMGFDPQQASAMMLGDPELLGQFERKAAAFLTSGNKAVSESSRIGANRMFNSIFRFQTYPMMKTQQFRRVLARTAEAWDKGTGAEKRAATEQLSRFLFGNALQGAITVGLTTLLYQGWTGAKIKSQEAQDEPFRFMAESFLATMGGPLYLLMRGANGKGITGYGEQALRMVFPYSIMREVTDMAQGSGQYKDLSTFDRIGKFLKNKTPGTKAIGTGMALFGLSQEDRALDASIAAYYRWRRDTLGFREQTDFLKEDTRKDFRVAMRKAVESLKNGNQEAFNDAWLEAAGAAGDKSQQKVAQSFRGRKLLITPDGRALSEDQKQALQKHIGFDAYDRLEYFDLMLDKAAGGVILPKHD